LIPHREYSIGGSGNPTKVVFSKVIFITPGTNNPFLFRLFPSFVLTPKLFFEFPLFLLDVFAPP
jgi:hypothetical protein